MERLLLAVAFASAIGAGVMAGFFYSFSNVVMGSLGRIAPQAGISAMQSINSVVLNPIFFLLFFGTALLSLVVIAAALLGPAATGAGFAISGAAIYLVCIIGVTIVFNVPMNDALAAADPASAKGAAVWADYLQRWTWWNHVRAAGGIASLAFFMAFLVHA